MYYQYSTHACTTAVIIGIIRLTKLCTPSRMFVGYYRKNKTTQMVYSKQSRMFVAYDSNNKTNKYVLHVEKNVFSMVCASQGEEGVKAKRF